MWTLSFCSAIRCSVLCLFATMRNCHLGWMILNLMIIFVAFIPNHLVFFFKVPFFRPIINANLPKYWSQLNLLIVAFAVFSAKHFTFFLTVYFFQPIIKANLPRISSWLEPWPLKFVSKLYTAVLRYERIKEDRSFFFLWDRGCWWDWGGRGHAKKRLKGGLK